MNRNRTLDFLKGLGAITVIFTHYAWQTAERSKFYFPLWVDMTIPVFMIISGYVSAVSMEKQNYAHLEEAYAAKQILKKELRFVIPFSIAFIIDTIIRAIDYAKVGSVYIIKPFELLFSFLQGGGGPGGYYFPVMVQFVFIFPVVYFIIRKYDRKGLYICGAINFSLELIKTAWSLSTSVYRLLAFRYILLISFGCYLAIGKEKFSHLEAIAAAIIGFAFDMGVSYWGYKPHIINMWCSTSMISGLYILPGMYLIIKKTNLCFAPLEIIGKASYDIFLAQMVFYRSPYKYVYAAISSRPLQLLACMAICLSIGLLFHTIEEPITRAVVKHIAVEKH